MHLAIFEIIFSKNLYIYICPCIYIAEINIFDFRKVVQW